GVVQALRLERLHLLRQGLSGEAFRRWWARQPQGMALGSVDQFTDVARPIMPQQTRQLARSQRRCFTAVTLRRLVGEMLEQQRNVFTTLAQRRNVQGGDVKAVHQVLTKPPGPDLIEQVRL